VFQNALAPLWYVATRIRVADTACHESGVLTAVGSEGRAVTVAGLGYTGAEGHRPVRPGRQALLRHVPDPRGRGGSSARWSGAVRASSG